MFRVGDAISFAQGNGEMRQWRNEADMFIPVCFDADRPRGY
jgi:hypothetical protein